MPDDAVKIQTIAVGPEIATFKDAGGIHHQRAMLDIDKAGVPTKVGPAEPMPVLEWIQAVREGLITGYTTWVIQGYVPSLGSAFQTIWGDASFVDVGLLTAASTVKIASTNANDTLAGSGARTLRIIGLDASGAVQQEDVNLGGQSEVATVNLWSAINLLQVLTVGATRNNEGTIWCGNGVFTAGVPSTKYTVMEPSFTLSKTGIYTVPTGKTAFLWSSIFMVGDTTKFVDIQIKVDDGVIERVAAPFELGQGDFSVRAPGAPPFFAGQMAKLVGKVSAGTAAFSALQVLIVKDTP